MLQITEKERKALLILSKDFTRYYNANSLSKVLGITSVGTQKILRRFSDNGVTISKQIGKSIVHKPKLEDDYTEKLVVFLLADEAKNFKRWKEEFKCVAKEGIVLIYGSMIKNYRASKDIDIMIIAKQTKIRNIEKEIAEIQKFLPKKLHSIIITKEDFLKNINSNQKAIIDIIRTAIVLNDQERYVGILKHVTGF